jgi:hypothetical protein
MFDLSESLRNRILKSRVTLLGVGPMSKLVTTVAVELANEYRFPVALIPSRRQVDAEEFGGGYVEGWSTGAFATFVRSIDRGGYALLSRDHSGPWQGLTSPEPTSSEPTLPNAMLEVKASLSDDIRNGFDLLHIDPSLALLRGFSEDDIDDMAVELIAHCVSELKSVEQCTFEVGTDEQDMAPDPIPLSRKRLRRLLAKLDRYRLPRPLFYVVQTGTKVAERRNIGSFDQPVTLRGSLPPAVHLPSILDMCLAEGLLLKEHNADYLSNKALRWHRKYGIHAANVAPEFGVTETTAFLEVLTELGMKDESEFFIQTVLSGGRWKKWMLPNSPAEDLERVQIAGHYHFSDPAIREIREKASVVGASKGLDTEGRIATCVREAINRYMSAFGYGGVK